MVNKMEFPGSSTIKNQPANAGDMRSLPDATEQLSQCATATEPELQSPRATATEAACCKCALELVLCNKRGHRNGTSTRGNQKAHAQQERLGTKKNEYRNIFKRSKLVVLNAYKTSY